MLLLVVLILIAGTMFLARVASLWFIKKGDTYLYGTNYQDRRFQPWRYGDEAPREDAE